MKFLLFFVSIFFSFVFYVFYSLWEWRTVLWEQITITQEWTWTWEVIEVVQTIDFDTISWNLLIESFIFIFIGIIFLYIFSDIKYNKSNKPSKIGAYKIEILYLLFYIIGVFYIFFFNKEYSLLFISSFLIFFISDILFNHVSNIKKIETKKLIIRYVSLILNYISSIIIIFATIISWIYFIAIWIIIFNIFFNIYIHKNYNNIISLLISIVLIWFLIYIFAFSSLEMHF